MTTPPAPSTAPTRPDARRPFAPKYEHRGWGITLIVLGGIFFLAGISGLIPALIFAAGSAAFGTYLLRGRGLDPVRAARASGAMDAATLELSQARGGAAVVAYRNLETAARKYREDSEEKIAEAIDSIGFDRAAIASPLLGKFAVPTLGAKPIEVYRDWIIRGQEAYDMDMTVRGEVHLDGSIQKNGNKTVDNRTANLQFVAASWAISAKIIPDRANEARKVVAQVHAIAESLKPKVVSAADIASMVDTILATTGQPPAEKLKQLSNLRFDRLLTDEQFEQAKARILGI